MEAKMTKLGRELLCKAYAGDTQLSPITYIALGGGGCANGVPIAVTGNETVLKTELVKKSIESHQYIEEDDAATGNKKVKMRYTVSLGKDELVDAKISEAGLVDGDNNLVAYITFLEKGKDQGMEFTFNVDEIF